MAKSKPGSQPRPKNKAKYEPKNKVTGGKAAKRAARKKAKALRRAERKKAKAEKAARGSWSNRYEDTFGESGWGFKAQQVLGAVRGKDFRHEKTKKKRGSYKGGAIDPQATFSYKFESDEE
eukprot:gene7253-7466_t